MHWFKVLSSIRALLQRRKLDRQMDEEMRLHVELKTQAHINAGMESEEARCAALRQFGQTALFKELCKDQRGITWFEDLGKDIKFALRLLGKNPGFTAIAVSTLAIGIGAATAIYSVLDGFAIHPVPGPNADRLSEITEFNVAKGQEMRVSPVLFKELNGYTNFFEKLALYEYDALTFENGDFLNTLFGALVTPGFFEALRARPFLGRTFAADEDTPGRDQVLIISYSFWQDRFGSKGNVAGTTVRLQDKVWTIVGVMPKGFEFPSRGIQYWRPMTFRADQFAPARRWERNSWCIAQEQPHVSRHQVETLLRDIGRGLAKEYPDICADWIIQLHPLSDLFVDSAVRRTLWSVFGALGFLLAVICATIAGLQTARLESRQQELSIRAALGAGRWRLIRQLLIESLILATVGGVLGLCFSTWGRGLCLRLVSSEAPMLKPLGDDWRIAGLMLGASVMLGASFGILPAWAATRFSLAESLKQGGVTATGGRVSRFVRSGLVIGQVALALVMVISASLLVRTVWKALEVDPGFDPRGLARVSIPFPLNGREKPKALADAHDFADRLRGLPGTISVGIFDYDYRTDYMPEGNTHSFELQLEHVGVANYDFFRSSRTKLLAGRWFDPSDDSNGQNTILVNERLARLCWPGQNAIGKRLWFGKSLDAITNTSWKVVVGVVQDMKDWSYLDDPRPILFEPFSRSFTPHGEFWVRTHLDHASFLAAVRAEVKQSLPKSTEPGVSWLAQDLYASTAGKRLYAGYLSALAGLGLLLAALGIYGVLSHLVAHRIREIGVRMALGAQRRDVIRLIVSQGAWLIGFGMLSGFGFAYLVARILRSQLFGVSPSDPVAWLGAGAVLVLAGLLASYLPARRATKVDPNVALRTE